MSLTTDIPKIMVFRPTLEEMKDFSAYITHMESMGAHKAGVAKVIPPKEFVPRKDYSTVDLTIPAPIQQEVMGHKGVFTQFNIQKKPLTYHEYKKLALSDKFKTPDHFDYDDLERKYWRNLAYNSPIYGADVSGTIYDKDWDIWNINHLQTVLDVIEEEEGVKIEGVNTAYLYFGMWKTTFAWHTEDMDLYSINYIHFGAPKTWYAIPPVHAKRLERLAAGFYPQNFQICSNFLRHKMTVISPQILKKYSIPYNKITQECGEFMITFPYGYHSGFNHGFNCAESTNFASNRWINFGKRANCCTCARDSVKINIDPFVRIFQPDRYEAWKTGDDYDYIEEVDGPMSDAQFMARMDRKPHKKEAALLKRKISQVPNKPRRHPVHKRGDNPSSPKMGSKRGRMTRIVHSSMKDAIASVGAAGDHGLIKVDVDIDDSGAESGDMAHKDVKEALQRKIKEKAKSKKAAAKSESAITTSPTKVKSNSVSKPPTVAKLKLSLLTQTVVKSEPSSSVAATGHETSDALEIVDTKPVKLRTKRGSDEVRVKEEMKKSKTERRMKDEKKSKEPKKVSTTTEDKTVVDKTSEEQAKVAHAAVVRTEHAYSYNMSSARDNDNVASSTTAASKAKEATSNTNLGQVSKESPSSDRSASRGKSKKKKKKSKHSSDRTKHRTDRGKRMKDFTTQEYALMKTWARSMFGLWTTQPNSFEMEQAYNASLADQKPGCCVCMLFYNDKIDSHDWSTGDRAFSSSMSKVAGTQEDRRMVVLAPEYCFAACSENQHPSGANSLLSPDGRSPILTCSQCMIAVHASCYGERNVPESGEWKCTRCREGDNFAECCLCNLRGGALKLTTNDTWAHIVCAMAIPEVTFDDVEAREPINIDRISPARLKLKCFFCRTFIKHTPRNGSCIQCSVGKCALSFHVTCAHAAGVIMEASDWPFSVYATCLRHPFPNRDLPRERPLRELKYSEKVIAKYKNNRYYKCVVVGERDQLFYHVLFDDGTFSDNLFAQDIESHECIRDGDPEKGVPVRVRWTDNELYNGKFVKSYYVKLYDVEFENESVVTVKREDVYAKEEPLPKRVKTRFSHASDMQHEDFLENKVVPEKYRHLPCRDGHQSDEDENVKDSSHPMEEEGVPSSSSNPMVKEEGGVEGGSGSQGLMGCTTATASGLDSLLSVMKSEPTSPQQQQRVKSEPGIDISSGPMQVTPQKSGTSAASDRQWNSSSPPVMPSWGATASSSPGVQSHHLSSPPPPRGPMVHSPIRSPYVSPRSNSGRELFSKKAGTAIHSPQSNFCSSPAMSSLNGAAGSSPCTSTMSASETAALSALASMSSQSPYLPSPSSTTSSSFSQR